MFDIITGAGADLLVQVEGNDKPYYPGDVVPAVVLLKTSKAIHVNKLTAALMVKETFVTEDSDGDSSTYTAYKEIVEEAVVLPESDIPENVERRYPVQFRIPGDAVPFHYDARLQCVWMIEARLDRKSGKDRVASALINVIVPPPGEANQPGEYGTSNKPKDVRMSLWLPTLEWVEGEPVEGKLRFQPLKSFDVKEIRMELELKVHIHAKHNSITSTTRPAKQVLTKKLKLQAGREYEFPFDITIPTVKTPSRNTSTSTVTWKLKGVLARSWFKSAVVEQVIYVYSGRKKE